MLARHFDKDNQQILPSSFDCMYSCRNKSKKKNENECFITEEKILNSKQTENYFIPYHSIRVHRREGDRCWSDRFSALILPYASGNGRTINICASRWPRWTRYFDIYKAVAIVDVHFFHSDSSYRVESNVDFRALTIFVAVCWLITHAHVVWNEAPRSCPYVNNNRGVAD